MKLPFFNIDDSYPLTLGVSDDYFTLSTRLKRLGRAPLQPRRRTAWLLGAALLISFAAVLPFRLTARAQNETKAATTSQSLRGTVRDFNGKPVGKATVYIMEPMDNGGDPRAQTQTDADGKFALDKLKIDQYGGVVFVDAGERGVTEKQFDLNSADSADNFAVKLPHRSFGSLVMLNQKKRPVRGVEVRLLRVGSALNSWMAMPRAVKARYRATSDAAGIVKFPPLPLGMLAQFVLADQISKPTQFGLGDLRGGKWAPLAAEDALKLDRQFVLASVNLVPPVRLEGRVTLEDGSAKGNVLILAHRVNTAQAAGHNENREPFIAQTRSNAQGRYIMDGLRPGQYYVWVYPEKQLVKEFIGPSYERYLGQKTNRVDFQLSRGALVQGVVTAKNSGKPVKGQTMWLFDSQENNQYVITDARGYFKFRALGGKQRLRVHENGSNSPPPGFSLPAQSEFNFTIKNGQKRDFKIELPGQEIEKNTEPIGGVVVGPDGKPVAGATMFYRSMSDASRELRPVASDKNGRFSVAPPYPGAAPLQLWADAGELTTPQSLIATRGQEVTLRLARDAWAHIDGQVVDENKKPLAGAEIEQFVLINGNGTNTRTAKSDINGRFRFERVRPSAGSLIYAKKPGYALGSDKQDSVETGQSLRPLIVVRRAPKTLSGIVYDEAGKSAQNYQVSASGQSASVATRADGKFYSSQVFAGPIDISIFTRTGSQSWRGFKATGGDKNIVIRLSKANRMDRGGPQLTPNKVDPDSLIGQIAPAIQATRWSNGRAMPLEKLRGQTVLLTFDFFGMGINTETRDLARSQQTRFQTIGIALILEGARTGRRNPTADEIAQQMGFPIAVDAVLPDRKLIGWQTFESYGQSKYAVIGRDGRVLYAGDKLDRAIALASASIE